MCQHDHPVVRGRRERRGWKAPTIGLLRVISSTASLSPFRRAVGTLPRHLAPPRQGPPSPNAARLPHGCLPYLHGEATGSGG